MLNKLFIIVLAIFSITACSDADDHGRQIFRYNESAGIASLDPAFARNQSIMWATHQLYNTLVEVDESLQIKPSLAHSWDILEDGKVIDFHLRNDVFFHASEVFNNKTRKLVASDVVYSFQRLVNPATASPGAWIFNTRVDKSAPFTAINDSTFRLRLNEAFLPILGVLSMQYTSIVPKEAVEFYGSAFRNHPVGTGPFQFVVWKEGQALILKKNPNYFEKDAAGNALPYLDGVKVSFLENKSSEFVLFQHKEIDFVNDLDASFKDEVLTRSGNLKEKWVRKIQLNKGPYLNVEYLGILIDSTNKTSLQQRAIRKALNFTLDKGKLLLYLRNSLGVPAHHGFIPPGFPAFTDSLQGYSYNLDSAKKYLKEGNYQSSEKIILTTVPQYAAIGSYIVSEYQKAGLNVELEQVPKHVLLQRTSKSEVNFFRGSWIADYPDAENYLSVFYGKNPAPPNYTRFNHTDYDRWYEQAIVENDESERTKLYRKMDSCIIVEAAIVPLWYDEVLHLVQPNIEGFKPNALNMLELRKTKKSQQH